MKENWEETIELEDLNPDREKIHIKDNELKNLLQYKLQKNDFTKEDLLDITEIIINGKTIVGEENITYLEEINLFPNLKKIEINNIEINKEDIKKLLNINEIMFKNCKIESIKELNKIKSISFISSEIKNIEEIEQCSEVESLTLINIKVEKFDFLKKLNNLKKLTLKNIVNLSIDRINFYLPIKYLSIEDIEKLTIEDLKEFKELKTLSIDRRKQQEWDEQIDRIHEKGINIIFNDIYKY